ncbi:MAG: hypothetical protein R2751_12030 [Bacteroidales bacterium]
MSFRHHQPDHHRNADQGGDGIDGKHLIDPGNWDTGSLATITAMPVSRVAGSRMR